MGGGGAVEWIWGGTGGKEFAGLCVNFFISIKHHFRGREIYFYLKKINLQNSPPSRPVQISTLKMMARLRGFIMMWRAVACISNLESFFYFSPTVFSFPL